MYSMMVVKLKIHQCIVFIVITTTIVWIKMIFKYHFFNISVNFLTIKEIISNLFCSRSNCEFANKEKL